MGTVVTYTVYIEPSTQNEDSEPINHLHMMLMLMMNEDSGLELLFWEISHLISPTPLLMSHLIPQ